jgi:3-deoxy-D-manno-octulosonate 8-phosphate phosphatase (KDO 8-P phosphatase)
MITHLHEKIKAIKLIIFDVDGVFTDGCLYFSEGKEHIKQFNVQDGLGIKLLQHAPIEMAIISGRKSPIAQQRLQQLGLKHIYLGYPNKIPTYESLISKFDLPETAIAYVGDDLPDLPIMQRVGLSIAVANANPIVAAQCMWQTRLQGGHGAVREICDQFLQSHDCLSQCLEAWQHEQAE